MFRTDADLAHPPACDCRLHGRRRWLGAAAGATLLPAAALAQDGVQGQVGGRSRFTQLVPAEQVEAAAAQQYSQMLREASQKRALAPADHPQVQRLRFIAQRMTPYAVPWNGRARQWNWEINVLGSRELNAFCMPGGKIAFYWGILQRLQLSDAEVAAIMGHEMAHALREHAREQMGKNTATRIGADVLTSLLGLGGLGQAAMGVGAQLLSLRFSRDDEVEADRVGLDLAARAGYDPSAAIGLWEKMMQSNGGAPPPFLSTHPTSSSRIGDIQRTLPTVEPLYARASKPGREWGPPRA